MYVFPFNYIKAKNAKIFAYYSNPTFYKSWEIIIELQLEDFL